MTILAGLRGLAVEPAARLSAPEDRRAARLFAALMLIHLAMMALAIVAAEVQWRAATGSSIWDDQDFLVALAGSGAVVVAYGLVRAGYLQAGAALYLASTAAVALIAPFVPDSDAEVSILAVAIVPVLVASVVYSATTTSLVLAAIVVIGAIQIAIADTLSLRERNTAWWLLLIIAATGALIVAVRWYTQALEVDRLDRAQRTHAALLLSEQARVAHEARYHQLFEAVTDGIFVIDRNGRYIEANEAACRTLGIPREELLALSIRDTTGANPETGAALEREILARTRLYLETEWRRRDGTTLPVELALTVTDLHGEPTFLGVARDMSERRSAEQEHGRLVEQLHHAMKMESIGRLAGGIAHDFNNLLTAILGNVEFALTSPIDVPIRLALQDVQASALNAAVLTRQLLAFSHRTVIAPRNLDLNGLIQRLDRMLDRVVGEDVEVETKLSPEPWPVYADEGLIEQVILNLVVNARDAMPEGGRLTVAIENVRLGDAEATAMGLAGGDHVALVVSDTGTGMSEETKRRIFEPFYTTKPMGKGTGLGLAAVWGVVKQSNGHVGVTSAPGAGATFRILLPRASGPVVASGEPPVPFAEPLVATGTILLVEDEVAVRRAVGRHLERLGYHVVAAGSGPQALAVQRALGQIDLLLTDVVMPGMNGRELADALRAIHPGLPVLFMSGYDDDIVTHHRVLDEGTDLLAKPFSMAELTQRVRAAMRRA